MTPLWVLGYGSLMSAHGLGPQAPLVRDAWPARLAARRAFAKPTSRGTVAMDLVDLPRATLAASRRQEAPGVGALLLLVDATESAALARREAYPERAWRRLLEAAGARGLAALLLELARGAGDDVVAYRRALREVAGPSDLPASHYLPHPLTTDDEPAVVFVAPACGETGDPACESIKASAPALAPSLLDRLFERGPRGLGERFDERGQATYVEKCLRAMAHGLDLADLLGAGLDAHDPSARLLATWVADPALLEAERQALRAAVPALRGPGAYARRFGPLGVLDGAPPAQPATPPA